MSQWLRKGLFGSRTSRSERDERDSTRAVCEVCPPGKRDRYYNDEQLVEHLRERHPAQVTWQLAKLKDQREGFGWRWAVPEVDAPSDGLCPTCGRAVGDSMVFRTGERARRGGELLILVIYCRIDGDIIRRISW